MSYRVAAPFDTTEYPTMTISYVREGLKRVDLSGRFFPFFSASIGGIDYQSAMEYVTNEMRAQLSASQFTMSFDYQAGRFLVSCSVGGLVFGGHFRRVFGFEDIALSATLVTGSRDPYFVWTSTEETFTRYSEVFEDISPQRQSVADDGMVFATSTANNANYDYIKFQFTNEPKWKVFAYASSSLTPYTWENHVQEMRSFRPWVLFPTLTGSTIHYSDRHSTLQFKGNDARFKPQKMFKDVYRYWNVDVFAKVLSTGSNSICVPS